MTSGTEVAEEKDLSQGEEEEKPVEKEAPVKTPIKKAKLQSVDVKWEGEGQKIKRKYYTSAVIGGEFIVKVGETVLISPDDPSILLHVATIVKM